MINQLQLMSIFVAVAEEQGFAAAARRLTMSPPVVTRGIASLEAHLGVKLLKRTTRSVQVTEAGQGYLEDCRRLLQEVADINDALAGVTSLPRGKLSVTAPVLFGRLFVMPVVVEYLLGYPDTEVATMFLDRTVSLLDEGIDVGVRIGQLRDSGMQAIPVGSIRRVLCASPDYLEHNGIPPDPADLSGHRLIASTAGDQVLAMRFGAGNRERGVRFKARLNCNTNDAALEAALRGYGITRLMSYQVMEHVQMGRLMLVLEAFEPAVLPVNLLHQEGRRPPAKVRAFLDLISERLRADTRLEGEPTKPY